MYAFLPRLSPAHAEREREREGEAPAQATRPATLPPQALRYAQSPVQRRESAGGVSAAENETVKRLSAGQVDLHGLGATLQRVPASDPRLTAVGARSLTRGSHALISTDADRGHELWHMAQQAMGRVRPTQRIGGEPVNVQPELEREADRMGSLISRGRPPATATTAGQPWSPAPVNSAAPIQRQVTSFKSTTMKRLPPAADLLKDVDYDNFVADKDDVVQVIEKSFFNPKKTKTDAPEKIKASVAPNSASQKKLDRNSHKSGVVGKIGSDNYYMTSKSREVFEGGHLIPHELWSNKDPQKDKADDYANLVPMSRTMNVGSNDHTWRTQEKAMIEAYNAKKSFKVTIDLDTPAAITHTYAYLGWLLNLAVKPGKGNETVQIYNWLPSKVNIQEDNNQFSLESAYENQIFNIHDVIDDGPELVSVLKETPIWFRCDPHLQEALETL